jgi:transposase
MRGRWEPSDAQWERIEPVLRPKRRFDGRGRPWQDTRAVLSGVLWVLGTGAQWRELPDRYPPFQTCHRRFQQWVRNGKLEKVLGLLAKHLHERGKLSLREAFIDATLASAKKGVLRSVLHAAARGQRSSLSPLITVFLSPSVYKALRPMKANSSEGALAGSFLYELPARLVGDRAYDSDPLDRKLEEEYGIELIAPHRGRRRAPTQDGRRLRRYRKRWRVERLFAWLHWFRRLVTRYEYHVENFLGMVRLACVMLLLKHVR